MSLCKVAKVKGYQIFLTYFWLDSTELAIARVKQRVLEGGHNIPTDTVIRRYYAGLKNFFTLYVKIVDYWLFIDNSKTDLELVAEGKINEDTAIFNTDKWTIINKLQNDNSRNKK